MIPANDDFSGLSAEELRKRISVAAVAAFRCRNEPSNSEEDAKALARAAARYEGLVRSYAGDLSRVMSAQHRAGSAR